MQLHDVLRRPLITEKGSLLQANNKYIFEVALKANKIQVKQAVEQAFGVKVISVNITMIPERHRRIGARRVIVPCWKKAVVTLKPGDKIKLFEEV